MKHRILAMLLAGTLMVGCMSACGSSTDNTTDSAASATESESTVEEEETTTEAEETTQEEESEVVASTDEGSETTEVAQADTEDNDEATTIQYPIADGTVTLTLWKAWDSGYSAFFDSYSDLEAKAIVEEDTGVNIEIIEVGESVATEQFNLMAASESWTDLVNVGQYYTGGVSGAYSEGMIYDLTDYIEEYMPDYYQQLQALNESTQKSLISDDGRIYTIATLSEDTQQAQGLTIRQDWLDELGLSTPETIAEFTEVMEAFYVEYGCSHTIYVDKTGVVNHVYGAFGSNAFGVSASDFGGSSLAYYQEDGIAKTALQSDGYREYLEWFIECYNKGLIDKDFYTTSLSSADDEAIQSGGETGAFHVRAEKFSVLTEGATDENYELKGIAPIVMNEGDTYEFSEALTQTGRNSINITTACEDLELAMNFLNYFFTDKGYITFNYGIEDVSYTYDENGDPQYTALVTEDTNANQMVVKYTFNIIVGKENATALYGAYWDSELEAMELWTETMHSGCTMPSVSLTTEESETHSSISGDIITYAQEQILRFITGAEDLNDDTWAAFQEELVNMGIDDCVAIYQDALDRYNSR